MEARFPGQCAKCGLTFGRGTLIKPRWQYDRGTSKMVRIEGAWVHEKCPKRYVDPETGEIIDLMQRAFDGTEIDYDEAVRQSQEPVGAFRPRRQKLKIHPEQGLMFEVDRIVDPT